MTKENIIEKIQKIVEEGKQFGITKEPKYTINDSKKSLEATYKMFEDMLEYQKYWNGHQDEKEQLINKHSELTHEFSEIVNKTYDEIIKFVKKNLINNDRFIIRSIHNNGFTVSLTDENGNNIFGHEFDVYFLKGFDETEKDAITLNVSSTGSFDVLGQESYSKKALYSEVDYFLSEKAKLEILLKMYIKNYDIFKKYKHEIYELNKKMTWKKIETYNK